MRPEETFWSTLPALSLENDLLRVVIVPCLGAKLVSLFDKQAGREWLAVPRKCQPEAIPYGADFLNYSLSGWDEMLPTIIACRYPLAGPFSGKYLPDHGEAWTLSWEVVDRDDRGVELAMDGLALPYRFTRRLSLSGQAAFCMDYNLHNKCNQPLAYLWAAHPLFACDASTRIILPPEVTQVINVQDSEIWGSSGGVFDWPHAVTRDGCIRQLDIVGPPDLQGSRKFYLSPEQHVSWAMVVHGASGRSLRMEWDLNRIPYLGIWVDEGCYSPETTLALEPSTAYYDSLEIACNNQRVSILPSGKSQKWQIKVSLDRVIPPEKSRD